MKKTKEETYKTKKRILNAAFECFFINGFKATSLEMIATHASLTRGAVYWHFKDKTELYREVVSETLKDADVVKYAYDLPDGMEYAERLYEVFWFAQSENPKVDFLYKTLNFVADSKEFSDLKEAIQLEKVKLFRYFVEETRMYIKQKGIDVTSPEDYASALFLLFEGLFLTKNISVGLAKGREDIERYIQIIIHDLL